MWNTLLTVDEEQVLKKDFVKVPDLSYLFVAFDCDIYGKRLGARISFDLENWVEVKASEMIFKKDAGFPFLGKVDVEGWASERTLNDLLKAFEDIRANLKEKSPSYDKIPSP